MAWGGGERRKKIKFLGINFEIPITWLLGIVALGLVQFGVFFSQFQEMKNILKEVVAVSVVVQQRNAVQDTKLEEHEKRLERLERVR